MRTKEEAEKLAGRVCKLLGSEWKVHIWENIGWHVSWTRGAVNLHYADGDGPPFWAMVGDIDSMTGNTELNPRVCGNFVSPVAAIRAACDFAIGVIERRWRPIELSVAIVRLSIVGRRIVR